MASGGHNSVDRIVRTGGEIISLSDPDAAAREEALLYLYSIGIDTDDDGVPDTFDPSEVELPSLDCEYDQDCHDRFGLDYICYESSCQNTEFIKMIEAVHYCKKDSECSEGYHCNDYLCTTTDIPKTPPTSCTTVKDCLTSYECTENVCVLVASGESVKCKTNDDCPGDDECKEGKCEYRSWECTTTKECTSGFQCVDSWCRAAPDYKVYCTADDECPFGEKCLNGVCETPFICASNDDCATEYSTCVNGECIAKCSTSDDCGFDQGCVEGHCAYTCSTSDDCYSDYQCVSGFCDKVSEAIVYPEPIVSDWITSFVVPSHLSAWSKLRIGWLGPKQIAVMNEKGSSIITLTPLSESSEGLKAIKIPLTKTTYYLVEVRLNTLDNNDKSLPDSGVLILFVDEAKNSGEGPVRAVNADPSDPTLDGATFDVREDKQKTFRDNTNGIEVRILETEDNNYRLSITRSLS